LKTFYKSWMAELTAFVELAEPIYKAWACDVSSQWHKQKCLLGGNPKKKSDLISFPLIFYFLYFTLFLSFSYILFLLFQHWEQCCVKMWGYWENFGFLCCFSKKKSLGFIFWTPIGLWECEYYVWELVERDKNINRMNECACKF
jgi:hypothetical protein